MGQKIKVNSLLSCLKLSYLFWKIGINAKTFAASRRHQTQSPRIPLETLTCLSHQTPLQTWQVKPFHQIRCILALQSSDGATATAVAAAVAAAAGGTTAPPTTSLQLQPAAPSTRTQSALCEAPGGRDREREREGKSRGQRTTVTHWTGWKWGLALWHTAQHNPNTHAHVYSER